MGREQGEFLAAVRLSLIVNELRCVRSGKYLIYGGKNAGPPAIEGVEIIELVMKSFLTNSPRSRTLQV